MKFFSLSGSSLSFPPTTTTKKTVFTILFSHSLVFYHVHVCTVLRSKSSLTLYSSRASKLSCTKLKLSKCLNNKTMNLVKHIKNPRHRVHDWPNVPWRVTREARTGFQISWPLLWFSTTNTHSPPRFPFHHPCVEPKAFSRRNMFVNVKIIPVLSELGPRLLGPSVLERLCLLLLNFSSCKMHLIVTKKTTIDSRHFGDAKS